MLTSPINARFWSERNVGFLAGNCAKDLNSDLFKPTLRLISSAHLKTVGAVAAQGSSGIFSDWKSLKI
jgi:hypothetical protein